MTERDVVTGGIPNLPEGGLPVMTGPDYATPGQALAAAPPPKKAVNWRRVLMLAAMILFFAACGVAVLVVIGLGGGWMAVAVGTGAALLPVPLLILCFLWLDRYEPEPTKYLAVCFAWGACVATATALAVNTGASWLFAEIDVPDELVAVGVAPVIEEIMKMAGPLLLFLFRRKAFSGMIDSIVYCGLSATGFAMVENILYLGLKGYADTASESGPVAGAQAVVAIFIARIVLTGFAHPLFTAMTAIGLGIAVRSRSRAVRVLAPLGGLVAAMMLHSAWNLMSVAAARSPFVILYGYFAVMVPIFLGMLGFVLWLRSSEGRLAERILPEYVRAGWLSPPEVTALGTLGRRLAARRWARRVAGDPGATAMKAFQYTATKLALLRDGIRRGVGVEPDRFEQTLAEERELLSALVAYRRVFTGRDPMQPRAVWDGARYHITFPDGVVRAIMAPDYPAVPLPVVLGRPGPQPAYPAYR